MWQPSLESKMDPMKKLSLMFIVLIWTAEFLIRAQSNAVDECCYSYASIPRNDSFCVPDGERVDLTYVIINPHDNFTNLIVTWFRSTAENSSTLDEISTTSNEYNFDKFVGTTNNSLSVINCSHEVYRDTFSLAILNFTQNKNGYYWCQLSINNTLVQPSHRAQFFAGECITNQPYYRLANSNENQCVQYITTDSELDTGMTTTYGSSETSSISSSTRLSSVTQQEKESDKLIIYVASSLSALVLVFGAVIIVLSILYLCRFRNREITASKPYRRNDPSNTENQGDVNVITASSTEAQASIQVTRSSEDDDAYSVVSDDSFGLHNSHPDNQSAQYHALPYEVAVFQGQSVSDGTQTLQPTTDSKAAALQPYDEVDYSNHNQQHRDSQSCAQISDEHHMYDEVNYEAKGKNKSIVSEIKDKKATNASELFDDIVYNVTLHAKSTKNVDEDHDTKLNVPKKQKDQPTCKFDDEHVYESADQFSKGQIATPPTSNGDKYNKSGEPDGTNFYHSLEPSENGKFSNPDSHSMPIDHEKTIAQDSQSGPTLYKCQFDDPMYDSNPHPGVDLAVTANQKVELKNNEVVMQKSLPNYRGDAETLPSIFDDPTYGECHVAPNKQ